MAESYVIYTGNGATDAYSIPFPFIAESHVVVKLDGVTLEQLTDYTISVSTLTFLSTPADGAEIVISRFTPRDEPLVDFVDGATLTAADLDMALLQAFYVGQEVYESSLQKDPVNFDAGSVRIVNVDDPVDDQDVATKNYVDDTTPHKSGTITNNGLAYWNGTTGLSLKGATITVSNGDTLQNVAAIEAVLGTFTAANISLLSGSTATFSSALNLGAELALGENCEVTYATTVTVDSAADKVLIMDASDGNKLKVALLPELGDSAVTSVAGRTGDVTLTKTDVGLSNVPNTDATSRANHTGTQLLSTISDAGTAAALNVPASGDAAAGEVVKGNDTRLTDARTPSTHASSHAAAGSDPLTLSQSQITNLTTDLAGKASTSHTHAASDIVSGDIAAARLTNAICGKQTLGIPAGTMKTRDTNGATAASTELSTNKIMQVSLDFDPATQQYAQFLVPMPKSWNLSTVTAEFLWTAASGSGGVVWSLAGVAVSDDDAMDVAFGTAQQVADTFITANDVHKTSETSAITIAGTPAALDTVMFQVSRVVANASDTLAVSAKLIGVRLYITTNALNDA